MIALDTTGQRQTSMLKFRVKNLLADTLLGLSGHIRLYDRKDDVPKDQYLHIIIHDTIPPHGWSRAFVSGASKSPARLPRESEADFVTRRRRVLLDWAGLLGDPARQLWIFVPEEMEFLNGSDIDDYGYERARSFYAPIHRSLNADDSRWSWWL